MTLYIVIPCYNEESVLPETAKRLKELLDALQEEKRISEESRVLFVNDGSKDATWGIIKDLNRADARFVGLSLSRNRGHQNALLAGLEEASVKCDCAISLDADLQDDIGAIREMLKKYAEGCEIVYGVRKAREKDTFFKRATAEGFYRFMRAMGAEVVYNHADYRLMSKRALLSLLEYKEVHLFLRGIVPQLGYKTAVVEYARGERFAGESKYPLPKMIALALEGITSFSVKPIRMVFFLGIVVFLISLCMVLWVLIQKAIGLPVAGWSSLMISIWMLGGLQLLSMGIIGEYIGKTYGETKRRPRYFIEERLMERRGRSAVIEYHEKIDSTNLRAKELARSGAQHGTLVLANEQTAGRGRHGREWLSRANRGAWMSLILRPTHLPKERAPEPVFVTAVALAKVLTEMANTGARIKWPNDIVMDGKKVCGMLLEAAASGEETDWIVAGIGVNLWDSDFPEDLPFAASVESVSGRGLDRDEFVRRFLEEFDILYAAWEEGGIQGILSEYRAFSATIGAMVKAYLPSGEIVGRALGVQEDGALILVEDNGEKHVLYAGDVSVRGIMGYA